MERTCEEVAAVNRELVEVKGMLEVVKKEGNGK